jgi:hypothetical protein
VKKCERFFHEEAQILKQNKNFQEIFSATVQASSNLTTPLQSAVQIL